MKSKRSKATDIPQKVKQAVWERDNQCCIICGNPQAMPNAHYISRAHGGLGVEENVVTLCQKCHHDYDNGDKREENGRLIHEHLINHYPRWCKEDVTYSKLDPAWKFDGTVK